MNKISALLPVFFSIFLGITSCQNGETYAEQKEKEREAIAAFLNRDAVVMEGTDTLIHIGKINVISEEQFFRQDTVTNLEKNEYVLFRGTGVYMQIVSRGAGEKIKSGETKLIVARYTEFNIMSDTLQTTTQNPLWAPRPDKMVVQNTSGTFIGSFWVDHMGGGAMYTAYGDKSVPAGWLVPFSYIRVGNQVTSGQPVAKVRLIVPHSQGQQDASNKVYPCFYEISYQESKY